MTFRLLSILALLSFHLATIADDISPHYQIIQNEDYPTQDMAVATLNVMDYGADPTGQTDQTGLFQRLLCWLGDLPNAKSKNYTGVAGGMLYVPEGKYLFKGQLVIPRGVTLRGDWKKPVKGEALKGTILMVDYGKGNEDEEQSFILMQPSSEVSHLTFWYPNQKADDIQPYPPTIHYGQKGIWGNDYCNTRFVTLVNSYTGIIFCTVNGGGCPNIFELYGTPLYKGVQMDCIADVGRFDHISFSPSYWADSQLPDAPSETAISSWLYQHATGFVMRRNDWSYTCNYKVEGYHVGFHAQQSPDNAATKGSPNGHNYGWQLDHCQTGILITALSNSGAMFTRVNAAGCEDAVRIEPGAVGPASFYCCHLDGNQHGLLMDTGVSSAVMIQECKISGRTDVLGGQLLAHLNSFQDNVMIGNAARTVFSGNTMADGAAFDNKSIFNCKVSDERFAVKPLPEFKDEWMEIPQTRPARTALYIVTESEFGAIPYAYGQSHVDASDCTQAIQKALTKAGNEGGGIVFLPPGHYKINGRLNIPSGVELKGACDIASVPRGQGAILEVLTDDGNDNGTPLITMGENSGLRGISINYPLQDNPKSPRKYPYAVRGNADTYIVNLALRTTYQGVDLFSNACDRHYVDYISGHCFKNVIRVGGDSKNGLISNIQCNTGAYANGDETKFGAWANSEIMADSYGLKYDQYAYSQNKEQLEFMVLGDCTDEVLYNNFLFGCNKGMVFQNDGHGGARAYSLGNAVDGAVNTVVVNELAADLDMINSQIVGLDHSGDYVITNSLPSYFFTTGINLDKEVNIYSSNNWGSGSYFAKIQGGSFNLFQANLATSGSSYTFNIANTANVNITNALIQNVKALMSTPRSMEQMTTIYNTVVDFNGSAKDYLLKASSDILPTTWSLNTEALISRTGWEATASVQNNQANSAIDGNLSSRWSTGGPQSDGQWWAVDMKTPHTFNCVILDAATSVNDGPQGYLIEVCGSDGIWQEVANGSKAGAMLVVTFPEVTAQKIRITQTGTKSNYWSLYEFYVTNVDVTTHIKQYIRPNEEIVGIYTISGIKVPSIIKRGIYIIKVKTPDGHIVSTKIVKK